MHNNFYFLRQLTRALEQKLIDTVISECYSQSKDELIIRFETTTKPFFIKASLGGSFSALSFPEEFHRAKKNSVDLFETIIGRRVRAIRQFENERSFALQLSDQITLLFKMHGNKSNIILFENDAMIDLFKNNQVGDNNTRLNELDRDINWTFENFQQNAEHPERIYFTFGKVVWTYLNANGFEDADLPKRWQMINHVKEELENPKYWLSETKRQIILTLLPVGKILAEVNEPIVAANRFYYLHIEQSAFVKEKNALSNALASQILSAKNFIAKNTTKLNELAGDNSYKVWADLIMANLHRIDSSQKSIVVENFYHDNTPTEIKLKPELSPQKNAEIYYRKSKNQQIELEHLQKAIGQKQQELTEAEGKLEHILNASDLKSIRALSPPPGKKPNMVVSLPYREFLFNGYRIWIGKNAESNDQLTSKYSYKDDLWLHAKDVTGSHVLIKHQAGKNFPKNVIERAAELAAYYSKRKNDSLCPVIVTAKKFVRKRKGDPAGAVVVEKEDVVMVVPKG